MSGMIVFDDSFNRFSTIGQENNTSADTHETADGTICPSSAESLGKREWAIFILRNSQRGDIEQQACD